MARQFYGNTSKLQKSGNGNSNTDGYTFFAAVRPLKGRHTASQYIVYNGHGGSYGEGWGLYLSTSNLLRVDFAFVADYNSNLRLIPGKWNGIVYMRRSGVSYMFANGHKAKDTSSSGPFGPNLFYTIGNYSDESGAGGNPFFGAIAHPVLWSIGLTDAEALLLSRLALNPYNVRRSNISQYHPLEGKNSSVEWAIVGSSLTPTNSPVYPQPKFWKPQVRNIRLDVLGFVAPSLQEKSVTDSGSGSDAIDLLALVAQSDTGAGSDTVSVLALVPMAETGSGSDEVSVLGLFSISDNGSGADTVSLLAQIPITDSGVGADVVSILALISQSDTGSGSDAVEAVVFVPVTDTGAGVDAISILALLSLTDTGSGADALSILAQIAQSDSGSGVDAVTALAMISISDSAVASDALEILRMIAQSDSATAVDAVGILALLAISDSAVATDAVSILAEIGIIDSAVGVDTTSILALLGITDTGAGADAVAITNLLSVIDSAVATDALAIQNIISIAETASGVDTVSIEILQILGRLRTVLGSRGHLTALSHKTGTAILRVRK